MRFCKNGSASALGESETFDPIRAQVKDTAAPLKWGKEMTASIEWKKVIEEA